MKKRCSGPLTKAIVITITAFFFASPPPASKASAATLVRQDGVVRGILGLQVEDKTYDARIQVRSFEAIFGDPTSVGPMSPTFFRDSDAAFLAASAIMSALGSTEKTSIAGSSDRFLVPFAFFALEGLILSSGDAMPSVDSDALSATFSVPREIAPYVTFVPASNGISEPRTSWLVILVSSGLVVASRMRKNRRQAAVRG